VPANHKKAIFWSSFLNQYIFGDTSCYDQYNEYMVDIKMAQKKSN